MLTAGKPFKRAIKRYIAQPSSGYSSSRVGGGSSGSSGGGGSGGKLSRSFNRPIKSHLNTAKNLFKYLNSTKDYSIYFSYNGNIVANLGPNLSNGSNTTTKLSRDFHSMEGPRPRTTTSTTIVKSRNGKGSSRTSIINSSLVPIGFSNSEFTGDKATSKST
ncbi:hypothetical protein P8C59_005288 [Phyllachora maydis]|uniref:Uncharacterized protein n=1 Tax=Phyllachora maydis TaxID=1825666 RepID=A0AAD9I453_9PEZI|nr:hypothetical protein P8C59_005288 [Phyllachora maydis]